MEPKKPPQLLKLKVAQKYCTAAGFERPDDAVIDCEEWRAAERRKGLFFDPEHFTIEIKLKNK